MADWSPGIEETIIDDKVSLMKIGDTEFYVTKVKGSCITCCLSMYHDGALNCIAKSNPKECKQPYDKCNKDGIRVCPCCGSLPLLQSRELENAIELGIVCSDSYCGLEINGIYELEEDDNGYTSVLQIGVEDLKSKWNARVPKYEYLSSTRQINECQRVKYDSVQI